VPDTCAEKDAVCPTAASWLTGPAVIDGGTPLVAPALLPDEEVADALLADELPPEEELADALLRGGLLPDELLAEVLFPDPPTTFKVAALLNT
jgi:hypothetical protein